jgi:hypothetical protein
MYGEAGALWKSHGGIYGDRYNGRPSKIEGKTNASQDKIEAGHQELRAPIKAC